MLGGVQFETGGLGPVPYLNILGGTSQKNHPVLSTFYGQICQLFNTSLQNHMKKTQAKKVKGLELSYTLSQGAENLHIC